MTICTEPYIGNLVTLSLPTLSVIIPVYNETQTIAPLVTKVITSGAINEVVIVDDLSTDGTREWLQQAQLPDWVKILYLDRNCGKGMAIRTALEHVTQEYVLIQDGDLEYNPDDYPLLLQVAHNQNTPVVYGSRFLNPHNHHSYQRFYWGGRLVTGLANLLYGQRLTDEPTCYKLFNTAYLKSIPLRCQRFEFCPEVTAKVARRGVKIMEVPIRYYPRSIEAGKKINWVDGLQAIFTLVRYRF